jgi:hypothetical protein
MTTAIYVAVGALGVASVLVELLIGWMRVVSRWYRGVTATIQTDPAAALQMSDSPPLYVRLYERVFHA